MMTNKTNPKNIKKEIREDFSFDDLKTGMICVHRSGLRSIVMKDTVHHEDGVVFGQTWTPLKDFNENFERLSFPCSGRNEPRGKYELKFDIVQVIVPDLPTSFVDHGNNFENNRGETIIWEREQPKTSICVDLVFPNIKVRLVKCRDTMKKKIILKHNQTVKYNGMNGLVDLENGVINFEDSTEVNISAFNKKLKLFGKKLKIA